MELLLDMLKFSRLSAAEPEIGCESNGNDDEQRKGADELILAEELREVLLTKAGS